MKIKHGYAFEGESYSDTPTKWSLLTPANFTLSGGFQETKRYYKEDGASFPAEFILSKDDLIVTMTDLSKEIDTIGYGALVPADNKYLHNQRIGLVTITDQNIDKYYVYWLMRTKFYQRFVAGSSNGATVHHTSPDRIMKFKWNFPPLPTQRRIAAILSSYDALIQNYKRQIAALQSAASELYKEWFVRFRFPGYKNAKFDNGLPVGWKVEKLGNVGDIIGGGTPSTENEEYWNGDIPWLSPADLSDNTNIYVSKGNKNITQLGLAKSSAKMMPKDTVLLSSRAPVGYVALAKNPICTNQGFKSVICNQSKLKPLYLYFFFKMNTNYLQSIATGATFPELSATMMKKIKVPLPNIKLQEQFVDTISASITKADLLFYQITNLTTQRDLLLPRLMSGKLSVK